MSKAAEIVEEVKKEIAIDLGYEEKYIIALAEKYGNLIVTDKDTRKSTASAKLEMAKVRTVIKNNRLEFTRPLDERKSLLIKKEKELIDILAPAELSAKTSIDAFDKIEEDRIAEEERADQERIDSIKTKIELAFGPNAFSALTDSESIINYINHVSDVDTDEYFEEFQVEASTRKQVCLLQLKTMLKTAVAKEDEIYRLKKEADQLAKDKAELDKQREEVEAAAAAVERERKGRESAEIKRIDNAAKEDLRIKAKQEAEQKKLNDERAALEAEKKAIDDQKAADIVEAQRLKDQAQFEREAKINAEKLAEKQLEHDMLMKAEEERRAKAEKERKAALKPDTHKLMIFSDSLLELELPAVSNDESKAVIEMIENSITMLSNAIVCECEKLS